MRRLFFLALFSTTGSLFSEAEAQSRFGGWLASFNTIKTGKKTSIHNDMQWRSSSKVRHMQTLLLRAGLNFHVKKNLTTTAGYAFISNRRSISGINGYAPEHRIWEQLVYRHQLSRVSVSHRFRLEQRFIGQKKIVNNELDNDGSVYANRFRYFIRNVLPFHSKPAFEKGLYGALQNEVFINFGNTSVVNGKTFDQNRFYLAIGYRTSSSFDIEAGYLNQYVNGRGSSFSNTHVLQVAGYLRL